MEILIWLIVGGVALLYWLDTAKARERAELLSKKACRDLRYQFLDGSVIRFQTRITRAGGGQLCLQRSYRFYFTTDGSCRWQGFLQLSGSHLQVLELDDPPPLTGSESHSLILSADYSDTEDTNAVRSRVKKRPDC
ncbi:DUF3301 domain-containing protein [Candidatus Sororendozoicomonas aggregata]|uniref:DUF3301 domain-containing protein n=1 Tax=Candidatus Sororendozoicomonas aggregata TaxID=3073239 RepID=UPI002ED2304D